MLDRLRSSLPNQPFRQPALKTLVSETELQVNGIEPVLQPFNAKNMTQVEPARPRFQRIFVRAGWLAPGIESTCRVGRETVVLEYRPEKAFGGLATRRFARKEQQEYSQRGRAVTLATSYAERIPGIIF